MAGSNKKIKVEQEEPFILKREDLERALEAIRGRNKKEEFNPNLCSSKKSQILDLCSHDPRVPNNMRTTIGGRMTNTQQLLYHLNKSALSHDWSSVAACVKYLLDLNGKLLPVIWKSVFLVLFNHRDSSPEKIDNFLQMCLGLRTEEEKLRYLNRITRLPENLDVFRNYVKKGDLHEDTEGGKLEFEDTDDSNND